MSLLYLILAPYALWLFYLAVMTLERARNDGKLSASAELLAKPIVFVGYALDVILNFTLFSLVVLDIPREWTITAHINRLLSQPIGRVQALSVWRIFVCSYLCSHLLNPFDPSGAHCVTPDKP